MKIEDYLTPRITVQQDGVYQDFDVVEWNEDELSADNEPLDSPVDISPEEYEKLLMDDEDEPIPHVSDILSMVYHQMPSFQQWYAVRKKEDPSIDKRLSDVDKRQLSL